MGRLNYTTEEVNTILDSASKPAPPTPSKVSSGGDMKAKMYFHRKVMPINAEEGVTYFTHQIRILKGLTAEDFPLEMPVPSELGNLGLGNFYNRVQLCNSTEGRWCTYLFTVDNKALWEGVIKIAAKEYLPRGTKYSLVCVVNRGYYERRENAIYNIGATHKEEKPKMKYPKSIVKNMLADFLSDFEVPRSFEISVLRSNGHRDAYERGFGSSYKTNRWTSPTVDGDRPRRVEKLKQSGNRLGPFIVRVRRTKNSEWQYFFIRRFSTESKWSIYSLHKRDTLRNRKIYKMTTTS